MLLSGEVRGPISFNEQCAWCHQVRYESVCILSEMV